MGIRHVTLCDTIGLANPAQVRRIVTDVRAAYPRRPSGSMSTTPGTWAWSTPWRQSRRARSMSNRPWGPGRLPFRPWGLRKPLRRGSGLHARLHGLRDLGGPRQTRGRLPPSTGVDSLGGSQRAFAQSPKSRRPPHGPAGLTRETAPEKFNNGWFAEYF